MHIDFFDDPEKAPKAREDVRFNQIGIYVHADRRRIAVGFDLTPFIERPSIEVTLLNERGEKAGSLHVIDTLDANFSLTMHLRDKTPTDTYTLTATIYYATPETERMDVYTLERMVDVTRVGEQ